MVYANGAPSLTSSSSYDLSGVACPVLTSAKVGALPGGDVHRNEWAARLCPLIVT